MHVCVFEEETVASTLSSTAKYFHLPGLSRRVMGGGGDGGGDSDAGGDVGGDVGEVSICFMFW